MLQKTLYFLSKSIHFKAWEGLWRLPGAFWGPWGPLGAKGPKGVRKGARGWPGGAKGSQGGRWRTPRARQDCRFNLAQSPPVMAPSPPVVSVTLFWNVSGLPWHTGGLRFAQPGLVFTDLSPFWPVLAQPRHSFYSSRARLERVGPALAQHGSLGWASGSRGGSLGEPLGGPGGPWGATREALGSPWGSLGVLAAPSGELGAP